MLTDVTKVKHVDRDKLRVLWRFLERLQADVTPGPISELMKAADQALYDAKRAGRNRVICCISRDATSSIVAQRPYTSLEAASSE